MRNIVFDLGRVLLDFDHAISFSAFEKQGAQFERSEFYKEFLMDEYERGDISGAEFLKLLHVRFPSGVTLDDIAAGWTDIFSPVDEMFTLASDLRRSHCVYVLSNTCDLHWDFVDERYKISSLVDGVVTSYEARARKPELAIYRFAEKKLGLEPAATVFIDDIDLNVEGARSAGWKGIHHVSPSETKRALRALGIGC